MVKNLFITAMCICLMTLAGCNKATADTDAVNPMAKAALSQKYHDIQASLESVIKGMYPGAVIVDVEYEKGGVEVEIIHDGRGKDVYLTKDNSWIRTEWDVRRSELPAAVTNQITTSWPGWKIDDAEYVDTPSGSWYKIELEKADSELKLCISPDGTVLR